MPAQPASLTNWARGGLVLLCLLLVASATMRIYVYQHPFEASVTEAKTAIGTPVDLGDGILLPRADAVHHTVQLRACAAPASIDFVEAHPYGSDPSLVGAPRPGDRVFYVYHGWNLGSRFATTGLNVIYFARRAYARLALQKNPAADNLAIKIIVPAGCDASSDDVLTALRREARPTD